MTYGREKLNKYQQSYKQEKIHIQAREKKLMADPGILARSCY